MKKKAFPKKTVQQNLKLNGVCINPSDEDIVRIGIGIASGVMTYDESLAVVKNLIQEAV